MGTLTSYRFLGLTAAFVAGAAVAASGTDAFAAKKKMTYEQAYAACKKEIDATVSKGLEYQTQRATAGGACMKRLGFRLKNPSEF